MLTRLFSWGVREPGGGGFTIGFEQVENFWLSVFDNLQIL